MSKLSIIIPAYNSEKTIRRCLQSVFNNNTSESVEVIVINDCSTDNTICVLDEIKSVAPKNIELKIISNKKNEGVFYSRNVGLSLATGDYIAFLDADDELKPDYVDCVLNEMTNNCLDVLAFNGDVDDGEKRWTLIDQSVINHLEKYGYLKEALLFGEDGYLCLHAYKSSVLKDTAIDKLETLTFTEDLNINIEIARKNTLNFSFINKNIYVYYFPQGSHISRINYKKMCDGLYVINKRFEIVKRDYPELLNDYKVGNLKATLRLLYAVKTTINFSKAEKKKHLKYLKSQECIKFTLKLGFKNFMRLGMKDKIRYILYK